MTTNLHPKPNDVLCPLAADSTPVKARVRLEPGARLRTTDGREVRVAQRFASGGEAAICRIEDKPGFALKLYDERHLTRSRIAKLERLAARRLASRSLAWPLAVVHDDDRIVRGFVMPQAEGVPLSVGLMDPFAFKTQNPAWTRRDSVRLALNILAEFRHLHANGVLMGDVSDQNILMRSDASVTFVDCDSYQADGFPCPVGTDAFTPPERQGAAFDKQLRTEQDEAFAIAVLLFKIMVPGKHPFSHQNGGSLAENIREGHFPYRFGKARPSEKLPIGPWRFCWSHLPAHLKQAFVRAFTAASPADRPGVEEWLRLFRRHAAELNQPGRTFTGPQRQIGFDLSILPQNYACWKPQHIRDLAQTDYALHLEQAQHWLTAARSPKRRRERAAPALPGPTHRASQPRPAPPMRRFLASFCHGLRYLST